MSLFFVRHQHVPEVCPAKESEIGASLIQHISPLFARQYGVDVLGEAVLDGQHILVLILEAETIAEVESFMQPFYSFGAVDIYPASDCETVIKRGGC